MIVANVWDIIVSAVTIVEIMFYMILEYCLTIYLHRHRSLFLVWFSSAISHIGLYLYTFRMCWLPVGIYWPVLFWLNTMKFGVKKGWKSVVPLRLQGKSNLHFCLFPKVKSSYGSGSTPVYLNVYDLTPMNGYAYWAGFGIFHSGVEGRVIHSFCCPFHCYELFEVLSSSTCIHPTHCDTAHKVFHLSSRRIKVSHSHPLVTSNKRG